MTLADTAPAMIGILTAEMIIMIPLFWHWKAVRYGLIAIWLIIVGGTLSGCSTTATVVPSSLLACEPQPIAPTAPGTTERQVGHYIVDLAAAGDDCRTKLGSVREILSPTK